MPEPLQGHKEDYLQPGREEGPKRLTAMALTERGWTQKMIRELLGEPDARPPNRKYPNHPPLKLYDLERVEEAERTAAFVKLLKQSEARKDRAAKSKAQQREKTLAAVEEFNIQVPILEGGRLLAEAMVDYYKRDIERVSADPEIADLSREPDPFAVMVLFLRWNTPGYKELHTWLLKRAGARSARRRLKQRMLQAIATAYPDFKAECASQYRGALWPKTKKDTPPESMVKKKATAKKKDEAKKKTSVKN